MVKRTLIPWEKRLGNIGESEIKKLLYYFSSPSKYETDAGIDFYCELIVDNSPSDPFYVQAKSTRYFNKNWGRGIDKGIVFYWLQQPSPVYLIVYDEQNKKTYWTSIEEMRFNLIEKLFTGKSKTIYMKMDKKHELNDSKVCAEIFVNKIQQDQISIDMFKGWCRLSGEGYVKNIPPPPRNRTERIKIKENIRINLYSLVMHFKKKKRNDIVERYCKFLTEFDGVHYNHFQWYADICLEKGDTQNALKYYKEALRICKRDKKWPKDSMNKIILELEKTISSIDGSQDLIYNPPIPRIKTAATGIGTDNINNDLNITL